VRAELLDLDWDFPQSDDSKTIHNLHPYPARFISEIPEQLIRILGVQPGTAVLDPFCGAGTTLVAAQAQGHAAIGVDLNPIACLISRVKTTPLPQGLVELGNEVVACAADLLDSPAPGIPNLAHWFPTGAVQGINALLQAIRTLARASARDHLELALSSIIVRVSRQESDTRYAAVPRDIQTTDVFQLFQSAISKQVELKSGLPSLPHAEVIQHDILALTDKTISRPISLVITSPPYPNAYEYWLYHKYRMWWLGHDPIAVREREIGARPHYFRKHHATYDDFKRQVGSILDLLARVVCVGGYVCFVVGRSRIHGVDYDNSETVAVQGTRAGFDSVAKLTRTIRPNRKSFNLSHARIKTEQIVVMRKA